MPKSAKKVHSAKTKTKRVTGQSKKNQPHFHPTLKVISLLGVIVLFLIAMVCLTAWQTQKRNTASEITSVRHDAEVEMNQLTYQHDQDLTDIQIEKEKLESDIGELRIQIEMAKSQVEQPKDL